VQLYSGGRRLTSLKLLLTRFKLMVSLFKEGKRYSFLSHNVPLKIQYIVIQVVESLKKGNVIYF
jgi:hypothetical protein